MTERTNSGLTTDFVAATMRGRGYVVLEGLRGRGAAVTGGSADSRTTAAGDLFVAFRGENVDGNEFVAAALERGATAAICERAPAGVYPNATIVVAPDARAAAGELAHAWLKECGPRVVAITGTVGKTTAKELTAAALSQRFRTHKSAGNFNSREGLPLAVASLTREHEVSVLEMGMDSPGEILDLCRIAEPEVGIVLNIGLTHASKLGSIEAIADEKLSLARYLGPEGTAILNMDDPRIAAAAGDLGAHVIGFGESAAATLRRGPITGGGLSGTRFTVHFEGKEVAVHSPLPGVHVVPAALAAIAAGLSLGMTLNEAADAVANAQADGRMRITRTAAGATVIDDRYNSSPASLAGALEMLGALSGRRLALLGKMAELGEENEEREHRRAGVIAAQNCDLLASFGPLGRFLIDEARESGMESACWFETKDAAAAALAKQLREGDHILVKGSRSEALETVLPLFEAGPNSPADPASRNGGRQ